MTLLGLEDEKFKLLLETFEHPKDHLEKLRHKAWQHYLGLGLPGNHHESYRYVKLRKLFSEPFSLGIEKQFLLYPSYIYPECQRSLIVFLNGRFSPQLSNVEALPAKVVLSPLNEAAQTYGALINNHWTKTLKDEKDAFASLNGALHPHGAFFYVPPNTRIEAPIQVLHLFDQEDISQIFMPRFQVFVGRQSEVAFVSSQKHLGAAPYFINQVFECAIEESAHVKYIQGLVGEQPHSWHFDAIRAVLKQDSTFKTVCVTEGSAGVRSDYKISLIGENAEASLNSISLLFDKKESHANVFMDHQAPSCRSHQLFKTVLSDFSRASFEGKIMVRQAAQQTEAFQLNKNIFLSNHAQADSKPNLEIFADNVKASHGATFGQLDPDQLFYMKARGFSEDLAKNLLIFGFCEEIFEMIPLSSMRKEIEEKAKQMFTHSLL